eukprot:EC715485.1.p2 GENE.EC715485.1~~EC715485.1.p2  ORF type:complete len:102 (+),score=8.81 EC715485.1:41-307(+)
MLQGKPAGTFLVRFSSDKRSFALSSVETVGSETIFCHALLSRKWKSSMASCYSMTVVGGREYEYVSIPDLVHTERDRLLYPCTRLEEH